jgi:hypothetical protein
MVTIHLRYANDARPRIHGSRDWRKALRKARSELAAGARIAAITDGRAVLVGKCLAECLASARG